MGEGSEKCRKAQEKRFIPCCCTPAQPPSEARNDPKNRLLSSAAFKDRHSTIEHEGHSHGHHTGVRWIDLILAGSAIFISVVSLIVSIHHGRTMEQLVAANEKQVKASTLPILRYGTGTYTKTKTWSAST